VRAGRASDASLVLSISTRCAVDFLFCGVCDAVEARRIVPESDGVLGTAEARRACDVRCRVTGDGLLSAGKSLRTSKGVASGFLFMTDVVVATRLARAVTGGFLPVGRVLGEGVLGTLPVPSRGSPGVALGGFLSSQGSRFTVVRGVAFVLDKAAGARFDRTSALSMLLALASTISSDRAI